MYHADVSNIIIIRGVVEEMMNNINTSGSQYSSYYNNHTILEYTNTEMSWKML